MLAAVACVVAVGCASPRSGSVPAEGGRTSDGALLTLGEEKQGPIWREWTPTPRDGLQTAPDGLDESTRAFDYWRVGEEARIEGVWSAVFPVVDALRGESSGESGRETLDLMLEALEPGREDGRTQMDLTYLVGSDEKRAFEGFACRLYRRLEAGATPVLTIVLLRDSEQAASPSRIAVWAAPGFREPASMTAHFRRSGSDWQIALADGLEFPSRSVETDGSSESGRLAANLLVDEVWEPFAGRAYADATRERESEARDGGRTDGVDEALGLEVRRREIDQVYSDTEFPPRAEFDELRPDR